MSLEPHEALPPGEQRPGFPQLEAPREGTLAARAAFAEAHSWSRPKQIQRAFRWLDVRSLWTSRNDVLVRLLFDPTDRLREQWIQMLKVERPEITDYRDRDAISAIVAGDTGEGDWSQLVVVPPLLALQHHCDFMVICSDVNYPVGDVNEYAQKFYEPYQEWHKPIYALPGNHDWYDEGRGFMFHFCGTRPEPDREWAADVKRPPLWRRPHPTQPATITLRDGRPPGRGGFQPAPYFVIDTGPLAIVAIDTGIRGNLDRAQGRWLLEVSRTIKKPKVLLTGKPLLVDGDYHPGVIEGLDSTVDDIVREASHGYVAAIGGDIHNYQRYSERLEDGRRLEYIVSGGGGAFMHATHRIPRVDLPGVQETGAPDDGFRCFPLRGDSLWFYASTLVPALWRLWVLAAVAVLVLFGLGIGTAVLLTAVWGLSLWWLAAPAVVFGGPLALALHLFRQIDTVDVARFRKVSLTPEKASSYMTRELGFAAPTVSGFVALTPDEEQLCEFIRPALAGAHGFLHTWFSEIFDVDTPPLYKSFLRLDADHELLRITCHAAIGVPAERTQAPFVEDAVELPLDAAWAALSR